MATFDLATVRKNVFTPEIVVGVVFLGVVSLLMVPVPKGALDLLLALSIALSAMVFLTAVFSERPTDFSIFPTLLLIATLLRLALNIASTRLILLNGHEGPDAAGQIILSFSEFVVGGNLGVGIVVFLILVIINFVVITKGAGRIAEVAARFTLDAMPGKQMAIDAELNSGAINEVQARERRAEIEQQANFYGAMDGASKFVRGDAIAGLIITAINLLGGLALGMAQQSLTLSEAVETYPLLTVGDGLVSQMPALVVSTAAGLAISRASGRSDFGRQVVKQMLGTRNVMMLTAGFLIFVGLLPGLPLMPFFSLAAVLIYASYRTSTAAEEEVAEEPEAPEVDEEAELMEALRVEALTLEVGYGLLPLVDESRGGDLPERVKKLRREMARELGIVVPPVRVVDNLQLGAGSYAVRLWGVEVARGELVPERHLAIDSVGGREFEGGIATKEPVFGLSAFWIDDADRDRAESMGMTVVDPSTVLGTHLAEVLRSNAHQLLGRDQAHELVGFVRRESPKLVEELIPDKLTLGEVVEVLQALLEEKVSVRNLRSILEAIANGVSRTKEPKQLAEFARAALARQITRSLCDDQGVLRAMVLERDLELHLRNSMAPDGSLAPDPSTYQRLVSRIADTVKASSDLAQTPCLLVANELRRPLRELLQTQLTDVPVVAIREVDRQAELTIIGTISADESGRSKAS